jgi:hypothetical protein
VAVGYGRVLGEAVLMRLGLLRRRAAAKPIPQ